MDALRPKYTVNTKEPCQMGDDIFSLVRWDKTRFNIDIKYPMSIMNAFGMALAIFELN
jgi:hypothetical protein